MHRGDRIGHTFNKQSWTDMLTMFNAYFGSPYDEKVLKSHYTNLWTEFNDVKSLVDQNGFSWDDGFVWIELIVAKTENTIANN